MKQYTIIIWGNRFGKYYSETLTGYWTKWVLKYKTHGNRKYTDYELIDAYDKEINVAENQINSQLIERTKEYYDEVHNADGEYPRLLRELEEE